MSKIGTFREYLRESELNESSKKLYDDLIKLLNTEGEKFEKINKTIGQPTILLGKYKIASGQVFADAYTVFTKDGKELESFKSAIKTLEYIDSLKK